MFTLIGLLGPAESGKDLVADWFTERGFAKVAFADPMKRFVQKAFGFSKEELWGSSEGRNKPTKVDPSWWFNAAGNMQNAFDEILNQVMIDGVRTEGYLKLLEWFTSIRKKYPEEITLRIILQTLGTEWGREVDPKMWTRYAYRQVDKLRDGGCYYDQEEGIIGPKMSIRGAPPGVIIPDHRFINELEGTKKQGGFVMRLVRIAHEEREGTVGLNGHRSENEQKGIPDSEFDVVCRFPEGVEKVHAILEENWDRLEPEWAKGRPKA